jgi:hypothetical protein
VLAISDKKNYSAEDGRDETNGYFQRNSCCSAEQKLSEFCSELFRGREKCSNSVPLNRNRSKIELSKFSSGAIRGRENSPFRGTKIEANFSIFVPEHLGEEKTALNSVPRDQNIR